MIYSDNSQHGGQIMVKELILFRHAKAEDISDSRNDDSRALTPKGVSQLTASLPALQLFIKADKNMLIWTSPMRRAVQTAEIIAAQFEMSNIVHFDFIGDGDFSRLADELAQISSCHYLIIVGHQPYLSDWSERIGDCRLPFGKASAASFKLSAASPPAGQLQWFLQAKVMKNLAVKPV